MNNRVLLVAGVLLIMLLGYVAYSSLEYYQEDTDTGWSKEARRNRFLAAEMYANAIDVSASSEDSYLKVATLESVDTLFLAESGQVISDKRLDELMAWVADGGHLIVGAQAPSDWNNDRILEYFDLTAIRTDFNFFDEDFETDTTAVDSSEEVESTEDSQSQQSLDEKKKKDKLSDQLRKYNEDIASGDGENEDEPQTSLEKARRIEENVASDEITKLRFKNLNYELRAHFEPSASLSHPGFDDQADDYSTSNYRLLYWAGDDWGTHLVQLELGYGIVTVLSNPEIFDSNNILYFDHALLWQVLIEGGDTLVLLYGSDMPSLWYMLKRFMPEVLLAFACFVVAWLWYKMQRFGVIRRVDYQIRRSILEHIAAAANFYWRGGWQSKLLKPVQTEIIHRAEKVIPAFSSASDEQRWALLAGLAQLNADSIKVAMQASAGLNEDSFTQTVKTLQRVKESL